MIIATSSFISGRSLLTLKVPTLGTRDRNQNEAARLAADVTVPALRLVGASRLAAGVENQSGSQLADVQVETVREAGKVEEPHAVAAAFDLAHVRAIETRTLGDLLLGERQLLAPRNDPLPECTQQRPLGLRPFCHAVPWNVGDVDSSTVNSHHYAVSFVNAGAANSRRVGDSPTPRPRSALDALLAEALSSAVADGGDVLTQIAVVGAVEELLSLDARRPGSWWLRGMAESYELVDSSNPSPTTELERQRVAGRLEAASDRGDAERVTEIIAISPAAVEQLIASTELGCVAQTLTVLADVDVARAVELAALAPKPFVQWERFVETASSRSKHTEVHARLVELLRRWATTGTRAEQALRNAIVESNSVP